MAFLKAQLKEKEMAAMVDGVYKHVMEDVTSNVRADFQSEDVDEGVLNELQGLWTLKLMKYPGALLSGTTNETQQAYPPSKTDPALATPAASVAPINITPVHDLNVPYEPTEEYETPTVEMLFPPTPAQPSSDEPVMYEYMPSGPSDSSLPSDVGVDGLDNEHGKPAPYMQQPTAWLTQKHRYMDMNVAYEEVEEDTETNPPQGPIPKDFFTLSTGKRKREELASPGYLSGNYIPQQDGAGELDLTLSASVTVAPNTQTTHVSTKWVHHASGIPQLDGNNDNFDDVAEEDYNVPGEEETQPASDAKEKEEMATDLDDGSEPPLNEADDDEPDDSTQGGEELPVENLVLAQFEKVTRTRNKWKCILKDGSMRLNKRDCLFVKAIGEFEF